MMAVPRHSDDDGLDGSPWYVRAFVRVGMPTAFASMLLWFLITGVTGQLGSIQQIQMEQAKVLAEVIRNQMSIIQLLNESATERRTSYMVLSAMCYNAAKIDMERARCSDALSK